MAHSIELANDCFTVHNRRVYVKINSLCKVYNKSKADLKALHETEVEYTDEFRQREIIKDKKYLLSHDTITILALNLQADIPDVCEIIEEW